MTLNLSLCSPNFISSSSTPRFGKIHETSSNPNNNTSALLSFPLAAKKATRLRGFRIEASLSESENGVVEEELLSRVSGAKDASEVLEIVAESSKRSGGVLTVDECCLIINAAIDRGNTDLALSIFYAMRSSFDQGLSENGTLVDRWKWSRPDVSVYTSLVQSLAASLKVSDALRLIDDISRVGVSPGEEVPFGKVVRCPTCLIAVAVAQPQHGIQRCNNVAAADCILCQMPLQVQTPSGMARTHRFATETVDLPAQVGERITVSSAAPSNVYRDVGPFKFSPKALNFYPGEPLCLTNHKDGRESQLLRAPTKDRNHSLLNPFSLVPLLAVLATGDAASRVIDPSLPQFLSVAAVASLAVGVTLNNLIFPQLSQLPQKSVDTIAIRQQLLSQYDLLQSRIKDLKEAAEKEISSMIEIEIEMDSDVLAAEAVSSAKWRLQAEANDEAERLINSQAMPTEQS
ncbi:pentatricopeptide repeat (PPR) superfamily protein [Citrus sinensis]|uniref:Pentatricopeptide repeat (PPR) superfamily protein n=1 Tax=Citrus sinensis TaxID=2711 RepID=A0ACB8LP00_CITSI|nr:pentatricopeptide repeat (PPR) superfamily protein [Citrus sinensis]